LISAGRWRLDFTGAPSEPVSAVACAMVSPWIFDPLLLGPGPGMAARAQAHILRPDFVSRDRNQRGRFEG